MDTIDRINRLLTERGKTGAEMSRDLGLSNGVYSQWNTRKTSPTNRNISRIAEYLGTTPEYLKFGNEEKPASGAGSELDQQLEGIDFALFGEVKDLTDAQKRDVLQFVKFLKQKE